MNPPKPLLYLMLLVAVATPAMLIYILMLTRAPAMLPGLAMNLYFSHKLFRLSINALKKKS